MGSEFHRNGIITGVVGSYCLLCEEYVTNAARSDHLTNPVHKDKMASSAYVEKYKDDHIRKVKAGYFCEPCNALIQTSSKVVIHIGTTTHVTNKTYHLVREVEAGVIAFEDILITKQAWNGQNVDSCYVCNVEYSDEGKDDHAKESSHVLNVIQSKLELKKDKFVYRKVDDTFINCLICNSLISVDTKESHAEDSDHVSKYTDCQENLKMFILENKKVETEMMELTKITTNNGTETGPTEINNNIKIGNNDAEIIDNDEKTDTNVAEINENTEPNLAKINDSKTEIHAEEINDNEIEAACNVLVAVKAVTNDVLTENGAKIDDNEIEAACNVLVPVKAVTNDVMTENSDNTETIVTPGEALKNVTQFARENHLKYKRNNTYCKVCDVKISSSFKRLKEHVAEAKHQEKAAAFKNDHMPNDIKLGKIAMSDFVDGEIEEQNLFEHNVVINERFFLTYNSYHTISDHRDNARCQICEVSMDHFEVEIHVRTWKHVQGLQTASKLTASVFDSEFVREVRPKTYHCGYCNFIEASLSGLKNHLKSVNHASKKISAFRRLHTTLEAFEEERQRKLFTLMMLSAFRR